MSKYIRLNISIWDYALEMKPLFYYILAIFAFTWVNLAPASANTNACEGKKLVVFGDSLVAGYGLEPGAAFPEQLAKEFTAQGIKLEVINAGVSGDTTTSGLARLDWSIGEGTDAVILELGANDALRGISPEVTQQNLDAMIVKFKEKNIEVLLAGMMAPPNMGPAYGAAFNAIYPQLAEKHGVELYPFFLDGVVADATLNQADGIHPTKEGIAVIVDKILPSTSVLLEKVCQ